MRTETFRYEISGTSGERKLIEYIDDEAEDGLDNGTEALIETYAYTADGHLRLKTTTENGQTTYKLRTFTRDGNPAYEIVGVNGMEPGTDCTRQKWFEYNHAGYLTAKSTQITPCQGEPGSECSGGAIDKLNLPNHPAQTIRAQQPRRLLRKTLLTTCVTFTIFTIHSPRPKRFIKAGLHFAVKKVIRRRH